MTELKRIIEEQQKGKENKPEYMIGLQLLDIAEREPRTVELLKRDLQIKEMSLEAAAAKLKKYSDDNHGKESCFCITPDVAEKILREFYGLGEASEKGEATEPGLIDVADFLI